MEHRWGQRKECDIKVRVGPDSRSHIARLISVSGAFLWTGLPLASLPPNEVPRAPAASPESTAPIKLPNPPEDGSPTAAPETPKVGSRDSPGG
jgi:hypothetical protein